MNWHKQFFKEIDMKNQEIYEAIMNGEPEEKLNKLAKDHKLGACKELERQWRNARTRKSADKIKRKLVRWDSKYKDMNPADTIETYIEMTYELPQAPTAICIEKDNNK